MTSGPGLNGFTIRAVSTQYDWGNHLDGRVSVGYVAGVWKNYVKNFIIIFKSVIL